MQSYFDCEIRKFNIKEYDAVYQIKNEYDIITIGGLVQENKHDLL